MTKQIFKSICLTAFVVFLSSILLFMGVLYEYFSGIQRSQLKMQTDLAAQGAENEGLKYFDGLDVKYYRITWIDTNGTVLYDSKSDSLEMENHLEREEIKQALSEGRGESSRYSVTLMERSIYSARRLADGTVLRLSITQNTIFTLLLGMLQPIALIFVAALILALALAFRLSRNIVKPLNSLNLDEPLKNEGYSELTPLFERIVTQQRKIRRQREELQQKQSEFETVTTGMEEGIILLNEKQIVLGMNPAASRLFHIDGSCAGKHIVSVDRSLKLQELLYKAGGNPGAAEEKKMEDKRRLISECNEKLEDYARELKLLPEEIDKINYRLMLITMDICYQRIVENTKEIDGIDEWVKGIRVEIKKKLIRKGESEKTVFDLYSYMHDIFGAEVIEIFDMKYNPEERKKAQAEKAARRRADSEKNKIEVKKA